MIAIHNERLLSLDVARGIAALCVVVFHWNHFYLVPGVDFAAVTQRPDAFPLRSLLGLVYGGGWMGVEFFFVLSGAIFFSKYREPIATQAIGAWKFFVLRFSRLYPLYFVTLLAVALLQIALIRSTGHFVMYGVDTWHFILNLLFVQNWFSSVLTFNAPAWSLSIEVFLYLSFFLLARFVRYRIALLLVLAAFGLALDLSSEPPSRLFEPYFWFFGRGLWCFYLGGAAVMYCATLPRRRATAICLLVLLGLIIANLLLRSRDALYVVRIMEFACIVAILAMNDDRLRSIARPLAFLGDISYSSYLLHFPLQLVFILGTVIWFGSYTVEPFCSPWMLVAFFATLLPLSLASFHLLEVPARRALRDHFAKRALPISVSQAS